jgi:hypothetical protein
LLVVVDGAAEVFERARLDSRLIIAVEGSERPTVGVAAGIALDEALRCCAWWIDCGSKDSVSRLAGKGDAIAANQLHISPSFTITPPTPSAALLPDRNVPQMDIHSSV